MVAFLLHLIGIAVGKQEARHDANQSDQRKPNPKEPDIHAFDLDSLYHMDRRTVSAVGSSVCSGAGWMFQALA